jgi:hypothetical protein
MTLSPEFVQSVREGRVSGLEIKKQFFDDSEYLVCNDNGVLALGDPIDDEPSWAIDHLCAHLRRWMVAKSYHVATGYTADTCDLQLFDGPGPDDPSLNVFEGITELDRHVKAALWVLGREG